MSMMIRCSISKKYTYYFELSQRTAVLYAEELETYLPSLLKTGLTVTPWGKSAPSGNRNIRPRLSAIIHCVRVCIIRSGPY